MNYKIAKSISSCLIIIIFLYFSTHLGNLFFISGFSSNSLTLTGGLIVLGASTIFSFISFIRTIHANETKIILKYLLQTILALVIVVLYLMNFESLRRKEAQLKGIELLKENQTFQWRKEHCVFIPEKETECLEKKQYPDQNLHYFECDDGSNFCGGKI